MALLEIFRRGRSLLYLKSCSFRDAATDACTKD